MTRVCLGQSQVLTAMGLGMTPLWQGLMDNRTAIGPLSLFADAPFPIKLAAEVPDLHVAAGETRVWTMLKKVLAPLVGTIDAQTTLLLATTVGEIEYIQQAMGDAALAGHANPDALLDRVKKHLGLTGQAMVVSSACASSTAAVGLAASMVKSGDAREVLVVAADALSEFVYSGFTALSSLAESPARPFDAHRTGLSLGEAAAWVKVCREDALSADQPGVMIAGWGSSADAFHMTAPDPQGLGLQRAIRKACAMAHCKADDLAFIAAHGTATLYSDAMELAAYARLQQRPSPVLSLKGAIGHTLGAAGIVQLLVAKKTLEMQVIPPAVGLRESDAEAQGRVQAHAVPLSFAPGQSRWALSTNSGFGGVNSALVLHMEARP